MGVGCGNRLAEGVSSKRDNLEELTIKRTKIIDSKGLEADVEPIGEPIVIFCWGTSESFYRELARQERARSAYHIPIEADSYTKGYFNWVDVQDRQKQNTVPVQFYKRK